MSKKTITIIVIVSVVAVIAIIAGAFIGTYNGIVTAREEVDAKSANIDVTLQRRADLVPNLVSAVKSLNEHEESIVKAVTDARAAMTNPNATTEEKLAANDQLMTAINVVVENYPEIKSTSAYTALMDEIAGSENRISVARKDYNDAVKAYNSKIVKFPSNLIANMFGFEKIEHYQANAGAETAPNVGELFG